MSAAGLVSAIGRVLIALDDEPALLAVLGDLEGQIAALRPELAARLAPAAPELPADCSAGHTWRASYGRGEAGPVARRECLVCGATETTPYTPPAYRRGGTR